MTQQILENIKQMLGIDSSDTNFNSELLLFINSSVTSLRQNGIKILNDTPIDEYTTWGDYFGSDNKQYIIKDYIYISVRLLFDPPGNATVLNAFENMKKESLWRIGELHNE